MLNCNAHNKKEELKLPTELIKQLLEAGVHFGHQTKRWNPKMKKFIFGKKAGIYIIDLEKTVECIDRARTFISEVIGQNKSVLFVGTKKQAQDIIQEEAQRCESYFVNYRWLGGLLTNSATIRKSVKHLKSIEEMEQDGRINKLKKKEISKIMKEKEKLKKNLSGIIEMDNMPGALFIIDPKREETAAREAYRLGIPIIALIDTNCDPDKIDYPIPGNDDALKSIKMIASLIADSVIDSRKSYKEVIAVLEKRKKIEESFSKEEEKQIEEVAEQEEEVLEHKEKEEKKVIKPRSPGRPKNPVKEKK